MTQSKLASEPRLAKYTNAPVRVTFLTRNSPDGTNALRETRQGTGPKCFDISYLYDLKDDFLNVAPFYFYSLINESEESCD
jgi:hypothetical protein